MENEEILDVNVDKEVDDVENTEEITKDADKTYTEAEMKQLLQAEADRRVDEALKTSKAKWLKEAEESKAEALRLASLSEEEKWKEELAKREQTVAEKELRIKQLELTEFATNKLSELNLPTNVSKFLILQDEATTLQNIEDFKAEFDKAVNSKLDAKLETRTPSKGNQTGVFTRETFNNLPYDEKVKLYQSNPEEYKQFI